MDKFLGHSRTLALLPFLSSNGHEGDDAEDADDDGSSDGDEEGILGAAANEDELEEAEVKRLREEEKHSHFIHFFQNAVYAGKSKVLKGNLDLPL